MEPEETFYYFYDDNYIMPPFGLNNTGAICWFNSILQLLMSLSAFNQRMLECYDNNEFDKNSFASVYCKFINKYLPIGKNANVRESLISSVLLREFSKELISRKKKGTITTGQEGAANGLSDVFEIINSKNIYDLINNKYERIIVCKNCAKETSISSETSPLINIYGNIRFNTYDEFRNFIKYHATEVDEYKCEACGFTMKKVYRLEQLRMLREIILITFKTQYLFRDSSSIRWYPSEISFLSKDCTMLRYKLCAQIEHSGSYNHMSHTSSGHYWANVLRGGKWYSANDMSINSGEGKPSKTTHIIAYHLFEESQPTSEEYERYKETIEKIKSSKK